MGKRPPVQPAPFPPTLAPLLLRNAVNDGRMSGGAVSWLIGRCRQVLPYKESGREREDEEEEESRRG